MQAAKNRDASPCLFGRRSGLRSTGDIVEQLRDQLEAERRQHAFKVAQLEEQIVLLIRDLAQVKLELARRDLIDSFAAAPSPSE